MYFAVFHRWQIFYKPPLAGMSLRDNVTAVVLYADMGVGSNDDSMTFLGTGNASIATGFHDISLQF